MVYVTSLIFILLFAVTLIESGVLVDETARISNGITAAPHQFPWHAALVKDINTRPFCGGTLIGAYWVLTAEHCVAEKKERAPKVLVGYINRTDPIGTGGAIAETDKIIRYSDEKQKGKHDIALIKLKTPLLESNTIKYARLPEKGLQIEGQIAYAMGHGRQDEEKTLPHPELLLYTEMKILKKKHCSSTYICAIGVFAGSTPCPGDSGGSLILKETNILLGADHAGIGACGDPKKIVHFTNVGTYLDWIKEKSGIVP